MNNYDEDFNIDEFVKDAHLEGTRLGKYIKDGNAGKSTLLRIAGNPVLMRQWAQTFAPLDKAPQNLFHQESFF